MAAEAVIVIGWASLMAFGAVASVTADLASLQDPGSPDWDRRVAFRLTVAFDRNRSGTLDKKREVDRIPCEVWRTLDTRLADTARFPGVMVPYGFRADLDWVGHTIGFEERMRPVAEGAMRSCGVDDGREAPLIDDLEPSPEDIIDYIAEREQGEAWRMLLQVILVTHYDTDGSGSVDRRRELEQVPCEVWTAVDNTLIDDGGLVGAYSLLSDSGWKGAKLGIDERLAPQLLEQVRECGLVR